MEKKYILWSDGVLTSMARKIENLGDGRYRVSDPANIVFSTAQVPVEGKPNEVRGELRFDLTPYIFGACLSSKEHIWTVRPTHILDENTELIEKLVDAYEHTIKVTNPVKAK